MYLVLLCSSITIVLLGLSGVGIYAYYYHAQCGPLGNREVTSPNQVQRGLNTAIIYSR